MKALAALDAAPEPCVMELKPIEPELFLRCEARSVQAPTDGVEAAARPEADAHPKR